MIVINVCLRIIVYIPQIHKAFLCAGVPGWGVLVKALQHELLRQNGIAAKIQTEKLS